MYYLAHIKTKSNRIIIETFRDKHKANSWIKEMKEDHYITFTELKEFNTLEQSNEYMMELLDKYA